MTKWNPSCWRWFERRTQGLGACDRRNLGGGIQVVRPFLETPGQLLRDHALEHQLPFHDEPGNLDPRAREDAFEPSSVLSWNCCVKGAAWPW